MKGHPIIAALLASAVVGGIAPVVVDKIRGAGLHGGLVTNVDNTDGIDYALFIGGFVAAFIAYRHFR